MSQVPTSDHPGFGAGGGDPRVFEAVFREQYGPLLSFATGQIGNRAEAEEVVQEIMLRVWRDRGRIGAERPLKPYLFAAVRNEVIDRARKSARERKWQRPISAGEWGGEESAALEVADRGQSGDPAELSELEGAVRDALAALPERCRTAFLLCREEGLTYAEAAEVMGIAQGTVRIQMSRALAALRVALRPFLPTLVGILIMLC